MKMNDEPVPAALKKNVDIESAINRSSYQIPVFVAISTEGDETQAVRTLAAARKVFDHLFPIVLDRTRQGRAVEAVENLVPESAHLKTTHDTEYVVFVRGKAIFWFRGAAAKRAASRRLLLEQARAVADAEQAPFYVLNSRSKKVRAARYAAGLATAVIAGLFLTPLTVNWTREMNRYPVRSAPWSVQSGDEISDQQTSVTGADVDAEYLGTDVSPRVQTAGRSHSQFSSSPVTKVESEYRMTISNYDESMANFGRAWRNHFKDGLLFTYYYLYDEITAPDSFVARTGITLPPHAVTVATNHAPGSKPGAADQIPGSDRSKK